MKFGCKGCKNRCEGCHVVCEQYKQEVAIHKVQQAELYKKIEIDRVLTGFEIIRHRGKKGGICNVS